MMVLDPPVLRLNRYSRFVSLSESPGNKAAYMLQMELSSLCHKHIQCRFIAGLLDDELQLKYPDFSAVSYILKLLSNYFYR